MSSPTNFVAKEAARILRMQGWLTDGTLQGANLLRANLRKAFLPGQIYAARACIRQI